MKRIGIACFLACVAVAFLVSSGRTSESDFECAVFRLLVHKVTRGDNNSLFLRNVPLFVGKGDVENARDPEREVIECIRREWPVKPVSESVPVRGPINMIVRERGSERRGWLIWMGKNTHISPRSIKVRCGTYSDGTAYEIYEFILHQDAKGWILQSERRLGQG